MEFGGILSFTSLKSIDFNILFNRFYQIKARGPDRSTFITNSNYNIGFHRLSIIDTSINGDQPFTNSYYFPNEKNESILRTTYVIVNGEIYNWEELKNNNNTSYIYKSNSDCEVVLSLFLEIIKHENYLKPKLPEYSIKKLLQKLNSEFAIAIFDIYENIDTKYIDRTLWLGRR